MFLKHLNINKHYILVFRLKIDIVNINEVIRLNDLPKIDSPIYTDINKQPTPDGLFSYDIFGKPGSKRRKFQYAYVDLKKKFLHPVFYNMLSKMDRRVVAIVSGTKYFSISSAGYITEDKNGETGLDFLYDNFEKIVWKETESELRGSKIKLLKQFSKDEIFVDKWLLIPPFYRDINLNTDNGIPSADVISDLYKRLIALSNTIKDVDDYFTGDMTKFKIQDLLQEIYVHLTNKISKKKGIIQRNLIGKTTDYAVRAVISSPQLDSNTYDTLQIPYGYIGLPIHLAAIAFFPFFMYHAERFFADFKDCSVVISTTTTDKEFDIISESVDSFTSKSFEKMISFYARSIENRTTPFKIKTKDGEQKLDFFKEILGREFTITDLLYSITSKAIEGKHVLVTRYPVESYLNIAPQKVKLLSTEETMKMDIGGNIYNSYPKLDKKNIRWLDSAIPNNAYLEGWGGNFKRLIISY